jgi:uncharacterized membrane protein YbaN (DUF454 family)
VGLGFIGAFLPLLPTTPFLLLAVFLFMRSDPKYKDWLMEHRIFGEFLRNYQEKRGMTKRHKMFTIILMWTSIGMTSIFATDKLWLRILLLIIAISVSVHLQSFKTIEKEKN